jgi:triosephosphate isomerase
MSAPVLVGTSTKMHLTSTEAGIYFQELRQLLDGVAQAEIFVLPPFTSLWLARDCLASSTITWGAQDVHPDDAGAHTGDVSAPMLTDLGCSWVEVGHSERRRDHCETDELSSAKVAQVLRHGMTPILCVGEPESAGVDAALAVVLGQLERGLGRVRPDEASGVVIAYEPVWAIGEGARSAPPDHIAAVHAGIAAFLGQRGGPGRVIYGGSVDESSAPGIIGLPNVDGLFVGRAALVPQTFASIVAAAVESVTAA